MKAMVLAAGKGERLQPLTQDLPKALVPLAGKPLLLYQLELLRRYGINEICINLHHMGEKISNLIGSGEQWGMRVTYSREDMLLGTAGAVKKVQHLFTETFIVLYADNLTNYNLGDLIEHHQGHKGLGTIACFSSASVRSSGILDFDAGYRIRKFLEKPEEDQVFSSWVNAGIYVLEPEILEYIPADHSYDFGHDLFPLLLAQGSILFAYPARGYLKGVDTLESLRQAEEDILGGRLEPQ